jgi:hypothetical protein
MVKLGADIWGRIATRKKKLGQEGPKRRPEQDLRMNSRGGRRSTPTNEPMTMENAAILITVTMTALASARGEL